MGLVGVLMLAHIGLGGQGRPLGYCRPTSPQLGCRVEVPTLGRVEGLQG